MKKYRVISLLIALALISLIFAGTETFGVTGEIFICGSRLSKEEIKKSADELKIKNPKMMINEVITEKDLERFGYESGSQPPAVSMYLTVGGSEDNNRIVTLKSQNLSDVTEFEIENALLTAGIKSVGLSIASVKTDLPENVIRAAAAGLENLGMKTDAERVKLGAEEIRLSRKICAEYKTMTSNFSSAYSHLITSLKILVTDKEYTEEEIKSLAKDSSIRGITSADKYITDVQYDEISVFLKKYSDMTKNDSETKKELKVLLERIKDKGYKGTLFSDSTTYSSEYENFDSLPEDIRRQMINFPPEFRYKIMTPKNSFPLKGEFIPDFNPSFRTGSKISQATSTTDFIIKNYEADPSGDFYVNRAGASKPEYLLGISVGITDKNLDMLFLRSLPRLNDSPRSDDRITVFSEFLRLNLGLIMRGYAKVPQFNSSEADWLDSLVLFRDLSNGYDITIIDYGDFFTAGFLKNGLAGMWYIRKGNINYPADYNMLDQKFPSYLSSKSPVPLPVLPKNTLETLKNNGYVNAKLSENPSFKKTPGYTPANAISEILKKFSEQISSSDNFTLKSEKKHPEKDWTENTYWYVRGRGVYEEDKWKNLNQKDPEKFKADLKQFSFGHITAVSAKHFVISGNETETVIESVDSLSPSEFLEIFPYYKKVLKDSPMKVLIKYNSRLNEYQIVFTEIGVDYMKNLTYRSTFSGFGTTSIP